MCACREDESREHARQGTPDALRAIEKEKLNITEPKKVWDLNKAVPFPYLGELGLDTGEREGS